MGLASALRNAALVEVAKKSTSLTMDSTGGKLAGFGVSLLKAKGSKSLLCIVASSKTEMWWDGVVSPPRANGCIASPRVSHVAPACACLYWGFVGGREL